MKLGAYIFTATTAVTGLAYGIGVFAPHNEPDKVTMISYGGEKHVYAEDHGHEIQLESSLKLGTIHDAWVAACGNTLFLFAHRDGRHVVQAINIAEKSDTTTLASNERAYNTFVIDPRCQVGFYSQYNFEHQNTEIYKMDLTTGVSLPLTSNSEFDFSPILSPNGQYLMWRTTIHEEGNTFYQVTMINTATNQIVYRFNTDRSATLKWEGDNSVVYDICLNGFSGCEAVEKYFW